MKKKYAIREAHAGVFDVLVDGKFVGGIDLTPHQGHLTVGRVNVETPLRGEGAGTQLYEAALREACKAGLPLSSDSYRSAFAEAFWRKQARKGRAVCSCKGDDGAEVYNVPITTLLIDLREGCLVQARRRRTVTQRFDDFDWAEKCAQAKLKAMTALLPKPKRTPGGRPFWPCARWTIPLSKCGSSLDGLRRRAR